MGEQKGQEKPVVLDSAELEGVTGGASWNDDPEAIENVVLDRMALGLDRVKEGLTSIAVRK